MRIGLIGLGDIAQKAYLPVVSSMLDVTPVLCTRNSEVLYRLCQTYNLKESYSNVAQLIASGIDAAMVHTSTEHHIEIVEWLLKAGIATFVDKPISYHLPDTERVIELSAAKNLPLFVGFNRRYAPLISGINETNPVQIVMQKNRSNLPALHQTFIYDDLINVIDTLLFLSNGHVNNLRVFSYQKEKLLAAGGSIEVESQKMDDAEILFGRDPDGNLLGFQALDKESPYSAKQFADNGIG